MTATIAPADATVTYSWAIGGKEYATSESITVPAGTEAGTEITLTVTSADGQTATATATVIAALELVDADQTGAAEITVEANGELKKLDKFTVKKGSTEVKSETTVDGTIAKITLTDKIVADAEYTITLTPADGDPETSLTIIGEKAELEGIVFLNDELVMKDYHYAEGYCYVKGYDQFGGEINLSGLTVTPGVGTFKSYDSNTGKITLYDDDYDGDGTGAYLLIKEVPVFVQYQSGTTVLTANKTLTVSTAAYVDKVEFGEIKKDGGNAREDGRLTVTELSSGKYYVEINSVTDQYGNTLDADDLNNQKNVSKTLFVIPGNTGAFYTTGDFGEVNGKTVLWITDGIRKGSMDLSITGAGGVTFTKSIEVEDDPFINTLTVVWPELYEGMTESAELEFSAVDQYGKTLSKEDLWNMRPFDFNDGADTILFDDFNSITTQDTKITANGKATFNALKLDHANKKFTITINAENCVAKEVETFTVQTAGLDIQTKQITVGALGYAAKIKSALVSGTNTQLVSSLFGTENSVNFNQKLQFEDANGNLMVRGKSERYPAYTTVSGIEVDETIPKASDNVWKTGKYVWSLTAEEVDEAAARAANYTEFGADGVVDDNDFLDADGNYASSLDVYATLYLAKDADHPQNDKLYKLDDKKFHLTFVTGADKSYAVKNPGGLLYATPDSADTAAFGVTVTTNQGETYTANAGRVNVVASNKFVVNGNTVSCGANTVFDGGTSDTLQVTVYIDNKEVGYGTVDYSNKTPVPTEVSKGLATDGTGNNGEEMSLVGASGPTNDNSDFKAQANATYEIDADGKLTITHVNALGDKLTRSIQDQYGQDMASTGWFLNGDEIVNGTEVPAARNVFEFRNGDVVGKFYLTAVQDDPEATITVAADARKELRAATRDELSAHLATAKADEDHNYIIRITNDIITTSDIEIPENTQLVVLGGNTLDTGKNTVIIDGILYLGEDGTTHEGSVWNTEAGATIINTGSVVVEAHSVANLDHANLKGAGEYIDLAGHTINLIGCTIEGGTFSGNIVISDTTTISGNVAFDDAMVSVEEGSTLGVTGEVTLSGATTLSLEGATVEGSENIVAGTTEDDDVTVIDQNGNEVGIDDETGEIEIVDGDAAEAAEKNAAEAIEAWEALPATDVIAAADDLTEANNKVKAFTDALADLEGNDAALELVAKAGYTETALEEITDAIADRQAELDAAPVIAEIEALTASEDLAGTETETELKDLKAAVTTAKTNYSKLETTAQAKVAEDPDVAALIGAKTVAAYLEAEEEAYDDAIAYAGAKAAAAEINEVTINTAVSDTDEVKTAIKNAAETNLPNALTGWTATASALANSSGWTCTLTWSKAGFENIEVTGVVVNGNV